MVKTTKDNWQRGPLGWSKWPYYIRPIGMASITDCKMFWLYDTRRSSRVLTEPGNYDTAVHFSTVSEAKAYADKLIEEGQK